MDILREIVRKNFLRFRTLVDVMSKSKSKSKRGKYHLVKAINLHNQNDVSGAVKHWNSIDRVSNSECYAIAQNSMGRILKDNGRANEAVKYFNNVSVFDDIESYTAAQRYIGSIFMNQGKIKEAIEAWGNIKRSDNPSIYASVQNAIGDTLESEGDIKRAMRHWLNVERSDDPKIYALAQYSIGLAIKESNGSTEEILKYWNKVNVEDNRNIYALIQHAIGEILKDKGSIKEAIDCWKNIMHEDDSIIYSLAQFSIGLYLKEDKSNIEEALGFLRNVKNDGANRVYAAAQLEIGSILKREKCDVEGALKIWSRVELEESVEVYDSINFQMGTSYLERFIYYYLMSSKKDYIRSDNLSSSLLGGEPLRELQYVDFSISLFRHENIDDLVLATSRFSKIKSNYNYEVTCYKKICILLEKKETRNLGILFMLIIKKVLKIVNILKIEFVEDSDTDKNPERKLAHYTSVDVANILLEEKSMENKPNYFRLNTVSNMNDPSEGALLSEFLDGKEKSFYSSIEFDRNFHAFFSCFTFNHDSLNQFRLYGKKDNKEASGVSLVLNKSFFSRSKVGGLSFLSIGASSKKTLIESIESDIFFENGVYQNDEEFNNKQPIMRCVYIDPKSNYVQLAQRNRLTFYTESNNKTDADKNWVLYQNKMKKND